MLYTFAIMFMGLLIGGALCLLSVIYLFKQKVVYDADSHATSIEIPLIGKVKTNAPAIALAFIGAALVYQVVAAWQKEPDQVEFAGEILVDENHVDDVDALVVGIANALWTRTFTVSSVDGRVPVRIKVPSNWDTYTGYAFAHGKPGLRPVAVGVQPDEPFTLPLRP